MDDFFDDFEDGFEDGDFIGDSDDDFMEDSFDDVEPEDFPNEDSGIEEEPTDDICDGEIPVEDAVFIGGTMMGWAYEEGIEESKRRRLEKKMDNDNERRNNRS